MKRLKVKIFTHCTSNLNPHTEMQINEWLEGNPQTEVVQMVQSESMAIKGEHVERNLTVTVLYREDE